MRLVNCRYCGSLFQRTKTEAYCSLHCAAWDRIGVLGLDDCWPWLAAKNAYGYGVFTFENKLRLAHREIVRLTRGLTVDGNALHLCDNPTCCNPCHLRDGNHQQNMQDMMDRGRHHDIHGEKHYRAVVNEKIVGQIREMIADGWRQVDIAEYFSIKRSLVADISAGRSWRK